MDTKTQTGASWGGIQGLMKSAMQPSTTFVRALAKPAILELGEKLSRFIIWNDDDFLGFTATKDAAVELAHQQPLETSVYVCDTQGSFNNHQDAFVVAAGVQGAIGPLPSQLLERGFGLAKQALADDIVAKRDIMIRVQGGSRQKHGNLPPLDSPPHPDREEWERVQADFDNAKIWSDRFYQRHP